MNKSRPIPFCYATRPHIRKHGPAGYRKWEYYRDWLRDEFDFICVYCLRREIWERKRAQWVVEHLIPRAKAPELELEYTNLVYACVSCNSAKSTQEMPDPCRHAYGDLVYVTDDGCIHPRNPEGKRLIRSAALDSPDAVRWRNETIQLFHILQKHDPDSYQARLSFPDILPDLMSLRPPGGNTKPDRVRNCRYQQKANGSLPCVI